MWLAMEKVRTQGHLGPNQMQHGLLMMNSEMHKLMSDFFRLLMVRQIEGKTLKKKPEPDDFENS